MFRKFTLTLLSCFALLCLFCLSFWLYLDSRKVADLLVEQLRHENLPPAPLELDIDRADTKIYGLLLDQLTLKDRQNQWLKLTQVQLKPLSLELFWGSLPMQANLYQGVLQSEYSLFSGALDFQARGILLNLYPFLRKNDIFKVNPSLDGNGIYYTNTQEGSFSFLVKNIVLNSAAPLFSAAPLPDNLRIEQIVSSVDLVGNVLTAAVEITGEVNASINGQITLSSNPQLYQFNLNIRGSIAAELLERLDETLLLILGGYMTEGKFQLSLSGTPSAPILKKI